MRGRQQKMNFLPVLNQIHLDPFVQLKYSKTLGMTKAMYVDFVPVKAWYFKSLVYVFPFQFSFFCSKSTLFEYMAFHPQI